MTSSSHAAPAPPSAEAAPRPHSPDHGASSGLAAVVPVRSGVLPLGADETVAEAGGTAVLIGSACASAGLGLAGLAAETWVVEAGPFAPARWAALLAELLTTPGLDGRHVLLPASPDGRDLAPRLAATLDRPLVAGAIRLDQTSAEVPRHGGRVLDRLSLPQPVVATILPGVRGAAPDPTLDPAGPTVVEPPFPGAEAEIAAADHDPRQLEELPPDPSTMDLAESDRIVGGGAGLGSPEVFERMAELAARLGASPGGTRLVTDHGWLPVYRQIGTTGVTVDPSLYVALGVSGAVQHTAGLGTPDHIISINTDPHCPMMAMAELAVVCDAPAFVEALLARLPSRDEGPH